MTYPKSSNDLEVIDVYYKQVNDKVPSQNQDLYFPAVRNVVSSAQQVTGNVAGWRQAIAAHMNATTTLQGTRQKANSIRGYMQLVLVNGANLPAEDPNHSTTTYDWYGGLIVASVPTIGSSTSSALAETRAAEQFLKKAQDALSSFQGGVFVAELRKAIHGIRYPATTLKEFLMGHVLDAKRVRQRLSRRKMSYRKLNQVIADLWLEKAYAWGPLVSDLESAAESLARIRDLEEASFVSAEGFDDYSLDGSSSINIRGPFALRYAIRYIEYSRVRFYGQVVAYLAEDPGSFSGFLGRRLGITLNTALPTAWELIPFSFVADYFSNLGAMISAYSFPTSSIRWCNRAVLRGAKNLVIDPKLNHATSSASQKYEYTVENPGSFQAKNEQWIRTPFDPGHLLPSFRLTVPGVGDWTKWLNLTALANAIRS
jgi:hypothetical protein